MAGRRSPALPRLTPFRREILTIDCYEKSFQRRVARNAISTIPAMPNNVNEITSPIRARRKSRSSRDGEALQKRVWRAENAFHILAESRCFIWSIVVRSRTTCAQSKLSGHRSSVSALSYISVDVFSPRRVFYGFTPQHCTFPDRLAGIRESVTA